MITLRLLILFSLVFFSRRSYSWGLKDLGEELAAPATTSAKTVFYTGSVLTLLLVASNDQIGDPFDAKQVKNNFLGGSSHYGAFLGNMVGNALYVGGMGIASQFGDPKAHNRAIGMFKASTYAIGVTFLLKGIVREPRPDFHEQRDSFPSGHSSSSFSFSGYITAEHGWGWGSAALVFSSFVAYSRINDERHRLHDVVAGATIGWVYGWSMSRKKSAEVEEEKKPEIALVPILDSQTAGAVLYREF